MSGRKKSRDGSTLTTLLASAGYSVGYAKPPEHTRFQKGRSGNPKGRPKGAKNKLPQLNEERMKSILLQEAYRTISVRDGERNVTVPMAQAIIRSLAVNAVKGQHRAQRLFTELLTTTEREKRRLHDQILDGVLDYKLKWDRELERRRLHGIIAPDPLPHPDHLKIDFPTGSVRILGPMTKEEQADLEAWRECKIFFEEVCASLERFLVEGCDEMTPKHIREELDGNRWAIGLIEEMLRTGRPLPLPDEVLAVKGDLPLSR